MFCPNCGAAHQPAANFCSGCGTKLAERGPVPAAASPAPSPAPLPALESNSAAASSAVKVLDAGDKFVLSGSSSESVEASLQRYVKEGARVVTPTCLIGKSWTAACTIPPRTRNMDDTQSFTLKELKVAPESAAEHHDDGCRVEEFGFKRIVRGPSPLAVKLRLEHMQQYGAEIIGEIEEEDGEWVAVVDIGGAKNTGYRW